VITMALLMINWKMIPDVCPDVCHSLKALQYMKWTAMLGGLARGSRQSKEKLDRRYFHRRRDTYFRYWRQSPTYDKLKGNKKRLCKNHGFTQVSPIDDLTKVLEYGCPQHSQQATETHQVP